MKKVKVKCTWEVEVEYYPPHDSDEFIHFDIEDNHCPGTGVVGTAIKESIMRHEDLSTCWACSHNGENKVLSIEHVEDKERN